MGKILFRTTIHILTIDIDNFFTSKFPSSIFFIGVCMCSIVILFFPTYENIALLHIDIDVWIAHDFGLITTTIDIVNTRS